MGSSDVSGALNPGGRTDTGGGLKVGMGPFEVAGAYKTIDQGKATGGSSADGSVWSVGAKYAAGAMTVTVGWLRTEHEGAVATTADDQVDHMNIQGAYDMGGGIKLVGVINRSEYDDETTTLANNNEGWAAVAGVEVDF